MRSNGLIGISWISGFWALQEFFLTAFVIHILKAKLLHSQSGKGCSEWSAAYGGTTAGRLAPSREERHAMILCLHLIHAVRVGYATLAWSGDASPWDHLCVGSDFDGLINPINVVSNVTDVHKLRDHLLQYLPQAEKTLPFYQGTQALKRLENGAIDRNYMEAVVDKFMFGNGAKFIAGS